MKLKVPYYSQFITVKDKYWIPRSCLPTCLKMILDYHKKASDTSLDEIIEMGVKIDGYGKSGWFHDSIITLAKKFGLEAEREEKMDLNSGIKKIKKYLNEGKPLIVSVIKFVLDQTKFHTVVITGYEENNGEILGFYFHDPESTSEDINREALFVKIETFLKEWRKMAIFIG